LELLFVFLLAERKTNSKKEDKVPLRTPLHYGRERALSQYQIPNPQSLACAEQQLDHQLIQLLIAAAAAGERRHGEPARLQRGAALARVAAGRGRAVVARIARAQLADQVLNLGILLEAAGFFLQDQVGAHAAAREGPYAIFVLGAVGMGVEVARAGVAALFQQLDQEERALEILGS